MRPLVGSLSADPFTPPDPAAHRCANPTPLRIHIRIVGEQRVPGNIERLVLLGFDVIVVSPPGRR